LRFDELGHDHQSLVFFSRPSISHKDSKLIKKERQLQGDIASQQVFSGSSPSIYSIDSYASLSRSSSLIQFESLERQLQGDIASQQVFSGSSPSIYSIDSYETANNGSNNNNNNCNKKSNLLTTYKTCIQQSKSPRNILNISDSEIYSSSSCASSNSGSGSSSYNSDSDSVLLSLPAHDLSPQGSPNEKIFGRCSLNHCAKKLRSKNSIESLSEDSGYCDHMQFNMSNLKVKSKSLTNFHSAEQLDDTDAFYRQTSAMTKVNIGPFRVFYCFYCYYFDTSW
jgi:hypothetical protein